MFTQEQLHDTFSKVKSGKDFPKMVQDLKSIGVIRYENFVSNGKTIYYGTSGFKIEAESKYPDMYINEKSSVDQLKHALQIHQQGKTDYPTFCQEAADAGVEKWITDMLALTVTYIDKKENILVVETIPQV